jgi:hypothetical protein
LFVVELAFAFDEFCCPDSCLLVEFGEFRLDSSDVVDLTEVVEPPRNIV